MTTLYRTVMVLGLLMLVICGLNISNQGMNSLTMQNHKPVIGLQTKGDAVCIYTLGQSHSYGKKAVTDAVSQVWDQVRAYGRSAGSYILKITKLMKVFIFS